MTITTLTTLTCDHKEHVWSECHARAEQPGGISRELMRTFARGRGWVQIQNRDYCEVHAPLHPTHGTVTEELLANLHFQCECGKIHGKYTGTHCPCGAEFPQDARREQCRNT